MTYLAKTIISWADFAEFAESLIALEPQVAKVTPPQPPYFFRGQFKAEWTLKPALTRVAVELALDEATTLAAEKQSIFEFKRTGYHQIPPNMLAAAVDFHGLLSLMQHYGAPTRILDWTASIYVALYFAVADEPKSDGAVWGVHVRTVADEMQRKYGVIPSALPSNEDFIKDFLSTGVDEVVYFISLSSPFSRMAIQQGSFSMCQSVFADHADVFSKCVNNNNPLQQFIKLTIPAALKPSFMRHLRSMNISANSLFPGLDGLGKSIRELLTLAHP